MPNPPTLASLTTQLDHVSKMAAVLSEAGQHQALANLKISETIPLEADLPVWGGVLPFFFSRCDPGHQIRSYAEAATAISRELTNIKTQIDLLAGEEESGTA